MAHQRKPPSQTWRTFLSNHLKQLVSTDFFVVPTVTFRVLYVFIVLAHDRRRLLHFNVTAHPTSEWTAPRSPWQNPHVERLVGSIRRECLDHIMVFNESSLRRILKSYFQYYLHARTHLSLGKDTPVARTIHPPDLAPWWSSLKSEAFITGTSGEPLEEVFPSDYF